MNFDFSKLKKEPLRRMPLVKITEKDFKFILKYFQGTIKFSDICLALGKTPKNGISSAYLKIARVMNSAYEKGWWKEVNRRKP